MTTHWLLEPRDPFIARDGRPFSLQPGARARTLPLPLPSTIAGAFRSRAGGDPFKTERLRELLQAPVQGPWLVGLDAMGEVSDVFFPAPADVVYEKFGNAEDDNDDSGSEVRLHRLLPIGLRPGFATNLPNELVFPLGLKGAPKGKPPKGPAYFTQKHILLWLEGTLTGAIAKSALGLAPLPRDERMHVALMAEKRVAQEGALFLTEGLVFESKQHRLALLVRTTLGLEAGFGRVGGEGRLAMFRPSVGALPSCPDSIANRVAKDRACRLVLTTPGIFAEGYLPTLAASENVRPRIVAAAVVGHGTVSGWNLKKDKRGPKPTRKFAPAGSVYFVKLEGDETAIRDWARAHWLASIADEERDKLDGWGLSLVGAWDGVPIPMEVQW